MTCPGRSLEERWLGGPGLLAQRLGTALSEPDSVSTTFRVCWLAPIVACLRWVEMFTVPDSEGMVSESAVWLQVRPA